MPELNSPVTKLLTSSLLFFILNNGRAEVLRHIEQTSRDHYYLQIQQAGEAGREVFSGMVGGEHINYYHLLAFQGEAFTIDFGKSNPQPQWSVTGQGVDVISKHGITAASASSDGSWITIEVSAHPQTVEYNLTITRYLLP